jgi:uncharacterized RDD family membrane protein YckC
MFGAVELATWGSRVGALLLDGLFAILPIIVGIGFAASDSNALEVVGVVLILGGLVWCYLVYYPVFMSRAGERNGWSLLRELVVRGLLFGVVGSFFFSIPLLLDYLWPLWDESNRALHDMVVSTHVVRADQPAAPPPPPGSVQQQAQQIGLG